jgi:pilus assembly protein FimV
LSHQNRCWRKFLSENQDKYRDMTVLLRNKLLGLLMLLATGHAAALTLGRVRGAAVVGQALDVSIQLQLGADDTATNLCLEADVFHADARQDPGRVRVSIEPTAQASVVNARITSSSFIDEPMVTVYLKAGCAQKSSRRYVLLADFPSESASPVLPSVDSSANANATPNTSVSSGVSPSSSSAAGPSTAVTAATSTPGNADVAKPVARAQPTSQAVIKPRPPARPRLPKPAVAKSAPPAKAAAAVAPKAAIPAAAVPTTAPAAAAASSVAPAPPVAAVSAAGQSRLKLDPLMVLAERVASLESSSSAPATDGTRDTQRMQSLEDSVKALVALAAKNEASLQDMRQRVQNAEADRVPVQWLYGLVALVLACLATMAYLWTRLRAGPGLAGSKDDWWRGARAVPPPPEAMAQPRPDPMQEFAPDAARKPVSAPVALQGAGVESQLGSRYSSLTGLEDDPSSELDVSLVEMTESNFDQLMKSGKSHSAIRPGPLSAQLEPLPATTKMQALATRPINSEQLFDVRQQADFFVSLGQTDQAVQILEKQINDHGETSPLIYLDLLQIFHSLNLKTDFRQFREDFNLLFNGRVPEFAAFRNEGRSLEEYPHVLAHITALWSTRKALMVIEASIFRDSLDDRSAPFDLAAFRELLLLHAIAQSFTVREEVVSDLSPLRANMAPISKGARLSASGGSGASPLSVSPPSSAPSNFTEVDIPLSTGGALSPGPGLPSVTGILNAPTRLDAMGAAGGELDLELDLDLSGLVALSPAEKAAKAGSAKSESPDASEVSDFSKLLRAQAPAGAPVQAPAKVGPAKAGSAKSASAQPPEFLADNLLDFDLSSEHAKLTIVKPGKPKA